MRVLYAWQRKLFGWKLLPSNQIYRVSHFFSTSHPNGVIVWVIQQAAFIVKVSHYLASAGLFH